MYDAKGKERKCGEEEHDWKVTVFQNIRSLLQQCESRPLLLNDAFQQRPFFQLLCESMFQQRVPYFRNNAGHAG